MLILGPCEPDKFIEGICLLPFTSHLSTVENVQGH